MYYKKSEALSYRYLLLLYRDSHFAMRTSTKSLVLAAAILLTNGFYASAQASESSVVQHAEVLHIAIELAMRTCDTIILHVESSLYNNLNTFICTFSHFCVSSSYNTRSYSYNRTCSYNSTTHNQSYNSTTYD